ncbi:hypothetical protein [Nocardioides daphniae]|nr:hypothetical protein [Nocardioides daphniae]
MRRASDRALRTTAAYDGCVRRPRAGATYENDEGPCREAGAFVRTPGGQ